MENFEILSPLFPRSSRVTSECNSSSFPAPTRNGSAIYHRSLRSDSRFETGLQARVSFNSCGVAQFFPDRSLRHAKRDGERHTRRWEESSGVFHATRRQRTHAVHRRGHFCNRAFSSYLRGLAADTRPNSLTYYFARRSSQRARVRRGGLIAFRVQNIWLSSRMHAKYPRPIYALTQYPKISRLHARQGFVSCQAEFDPD